MNLITRSYQERRLIQRISRQQDPEAFAELYDAYIDKIYRFVILKISNKEEAEDVTSQVFLQAWRYLSDPQKKQVESLSGLLYTIARRLVVDVYRQRAKQRETSLDEARGIADDTDVVASISVKQSSAVLLDHIKQLKQEYQEVIVMRFLDELSIKEMSVILKKKPTNVRVLLHRAIKKLKDMQTPKDMNQ